MSGNAVPEEFESRCPNCGRESGDEPGYPCDVCGAEGDPLSLTHSPFTYEPHDDADL